MVRSRVVKCRAEWIGVELMTRRQSQEMASRQRFKKSSHRNYKFPLYAVYVSLSQAPHIIIRRTTLPERPSVHLLGIWFSRGYPAFGNFIHLLLTPPPTQILSHSFIYGVCAFGTVASGHMPQLFIDLCISFFQLR